MTVAALNANTAAVTLNTAALVRLRSAVVTAQQAAAPAPGVNAPPSSNAPKREPGVIAGLGDAFAASRASILDLVAAADPSAFATFGASIQGVALELGRVFVPAVLTASQGLQDAQAWLNSFDSGTRGTVATVATWTLGITGAAAGVRAFGGALAYAYAPLLRIGTLLLTTPWGIAITSVAALTAGVTYLAGAWGKTGDAARNAASSMVDASGINPPRQEVRRLDPVDLTALPEQERKKLSGAPVERQADVLATYKRSIETELQDAKRAQLDAAVRANSTPEGRNAAIIADAMTELQTAAERINARLVEKLPNYADLGPANFAAVSEARSEASAAATEARNKAFQRARDRGLPAELAAEIGLTTTSGAVARDREGGRYTPRPMNFTAPSSNAALDAAAKVSALEGRLKGVDKLLTQVGTPQNRLVEDFASPIRSRYSDPLSFRDAVQTQALNVGEKSAQNALDAMNNMAQRMGDGNAILTEIRDGVAELSKLPWLFGR